MAPRLTYSRLILSLHVRLDALPTELPGPNNVLRRKEIEKVIKSALVSAQLGHTGNEDVLKPLPLKRWIENEFDRVINRFARSESLSPASSDVEFTHDTDYTERNQSSLLDDDDNSPGMQMIHQMRQAFDEAEKTKTPPKMLLHRPITSPSNRVTKPSAVTKRPIMNTLARDRALQAEVETRQTRKRSTREASTVSRLLARTAADHEAAAALLDFAAQPPVPASMGLPPIPSLSGTAREGFLKGVKYAWEARGHPRFDESFVGAVEKEVGAAGKTFWDVI